MISPVTTKLRKPFFLALMLLLMIPLSVGLAGCGEDEPTVDEMVDQILEDADASFNTDYEVKVTDMVFPFVHDDDLYGPQTGNQWVKVTISVENTGDPEGFHSVVAGFMDFEIEASDGMMYTAVLPTIDNEFGSSRSPEPGKTETGDLVFEIPEGTSPVTMWETVGGEAIEVELPAS